MARAGKGTISPLLPIAIIAVVVLAVMVAVFSATGTEPPSQATIIAEDEVEAAPGGSGTAPEGEADETNEGVTDVVDEVSPAAPGEQQLPAEDEVQAGTPDQGTEGETDADEQVTGTVNSPVAGDDADGAGQTGQSGQAAQSDQSGGSDAADTASGGGSGDEPRTAGATQSGEAGSGGADAQLGDEGSANPQAEGGEADTFLMDDDSDNPTGTPSTTVPSDGGENLPEGRDAETRLDPEPGQDVVRDTDEGAAAFVPTPSGPEGRDNETINAE